MPSNRRQSAWPADWLAVQLLSMDRKAILGYAEDAQRSEHDLAIAGHRANVFGDGIARRLVWRRPSIAGCAGTTSRTVRITHPFHPLVGCEFVLVCRRLDWGEDRVVYLSAEGTLRSIAAGLTDVEPPDEFQRIAAGRAAFRTADLHELHAILARLDVADGM